MPVLMHIHSCRCLHKGFKSEVEANQASADRTAKCAKFRLHPDFMNQTGMHPLGEEEGGDEGRAWKNFRGGGGK